MFVNHEMILEKSSALRKQCIQLDDQQKTNHENPSYLPSTKFTSLKNYRVYDIWLFPVMKTIICNMHTSLPMKFVSILQNVASCVLSSVTL